MAVKIYYFLVIVLAILPHYIASTNPVKSFKVNEKVKYDCVDVHKQPSLKHPLLKNHKLQIKPPRLSSNPPSTSPSTRSPMRTRKIICPIGTVPILRKFDEDNARTDVFARNSLNPNSNSADKPCAHFAVVNSKTDSGKYTGIRAGISGHKLTIANDQMSSAKISLETSANGQNNGIHAGWMYNPSLFGDSRLWTFGYWLGDNGSGCYNTLCTGFVQVSPSDPLSQPIDIGSSSNLDQFIMDISIHKDAKTGNWWIQNYIGDKATDIGYWPKELFKQMDSGSDTAVFGGFVSSSATGSSPPMGNGDFPTGKKIDETAVIVRMQLAVNGGNLEKANKFPLTEAMDSTCYKVENRGDSSGNINVALAYGGPGGNSCGT